jgi:hypothetical protein
MRVSAVPTGEKVVGTGGNKPNPQILRIELLASYAHEIAHSAAALHYGGLFVPTVPTRGGTCGNTESLVPQGMPHVPTVPAEKHGEVK